VLSSLVCPRSFRICSIGIPRSSRVVATECLKEWGYTRSVIRASAADFKLTIDQL
jgi:hypothetical protein